MLLAIPAHPALHPLFEVLGYAAAFSWYRRHRDPLADPLTDTQRWNIIAAAAIGALIGSHLLGIAEQLPRLQTLSWTIFFTLGGKTIVGALLGGWLAVEIAKHAQHIRIRTGDMFAIPLCIGITIGRIGCFLAGLADDTCGSPTRLPWAIDFGDGIPRHPTQLYEIAFLVLLAICLNALSHRYRPAGSVFRIFLAAYLSWRLIVDFLKPQPVVLGLNLIQWSCVAGLIALAIPLIHNSLASRTELATGA